MKETIIKLEEALRLAMLTNDVEKLDELISASLLFVTPNGVVANKEMDLEAHRARLQKMTKLEPYEQDIKMHDNLAVVTVKMELMGTYGDFDISGNYRYIRTWAKNNERWQVVAGAVVQIP